MSATRGYIIMSKFRLFKKRDKKARAYKRTFKGICGALGWKQLFKLNQREA